MLDELAALPRLGDWVTEAACRGLGDIYTAATRPDAAEMAVVERVCRRCPVRSDCATFADQHPVRGVYAGQWRSTWTFARGELSEAS